MRTIGWIALLSGAALAAPALAQYPAKPIRMVVPYVAGGATDIAARIVTPHMAESFGHQIVIDNRGGGATLPGCDIVAKSPPDGYTILMANIALGANPSLFRKMPYDTAKDFAPVSLIVTVPMLLVVHPSVPARSVKELIAYAKGRPGALNYASAGNGSANHLIMEVFKSMAGIDVVHVPYKGAAPAIADLVGGQTVVMFASTLATLQFVKSGKLIALGVSSAKRNPTVPDVPTVAETGLAGFDVNEWQMILAPARTPPAIVERLQREAAKSLAAADVKERIAGLGANPVGNTPQEAAAFLHGELARWAKVAKEAGIKPVD
ncbi:MAG TPA: tripartite tricarboxylate transporter substrate binding protein [Burkholderiales bacterium]|nr:tripartite tricarboxylate transporter substrate binding protein [Burkholderiales bacterium]